MVDLDNMMLAWPGSERKALDVRYDKTNMTSLWDCQHDSLLRVSIVPRGQPHRNVIFVYYQTIFSRLHVEGAIKSQNALKLAHA